VGNWAQTDITKNKAERRGGIARKFRHALCYLHPGGLQVRAIGGSFIPTLNERGPAMFRRRRCTGINIRRNLLRAADAAMVSGFVCRC